MKKCVFIISLLLSFMVKAESINMTTDAKKSQFTVSLPANPTTGYQWQVKQYDQNLFNLVQSNYLPDQKLPGAVGSGGVSNYIFALKKGKAYPNKTVLVFTYVRPWDLSTGMDKTVIVSFK